MAEKAGEARRALLEATRSFVRAKKAYEGRRDELHAAIVAAVRSGETKSQVARDTGYTREYVTALVVEADKRDAAKAAACTASE